MKTIQTLFLAAALCSLAACSDDDTTVTDTTGQQMQGVYTLTDINVPESVDFNMDGTASDNLVDESPCYEESHITLNADYTYTADLNTVLIIEQAECTNEMGGGTWALSGNTLTLTNTMIDPAVTITYNYSDGMLTRTVESYLYPNRDELDAPVYSTGTAVFTYTKDPE